MAPALLAPLAPAAAALVAPPVGDWRPAPVAMPSSTRMTLRPGMTGGGRPGA